LKKLSLFAKHNQHGDKSNEKLFSIESLDRDDNEIRLIKFKDIKKKTFLDLSLKKFSMLLSIFNHISRNVRSGNKFDTLSVKIFLY